ncbi:hypothetical protein DRW03_19090 [Corallococcus sp. H22C18031201]|nr:hypothetical protein DRW03_19090 [Corallococcus sp. H22C18031201]
MLALVLMCAVAYAGSVLHFALVQHVTCWEHGEVIHLDEVARDGHQKAMESAFDDVRIAQSNRAMPVRHGAEAHCHHAFCRREAPAPASSLMQSPVLSSRASPALAVFRFHAEPVERLRLAPKSSPPRV